MNAKGVVIGLLCAAASVGVMVWLTVEHQARFRLREENRALQQQLGQLDEASADNQRLSNLAAQASRSRSLPDDQLRELLRLRGEAGVLRRLTQELETARNENRQAHAALESGLKIRGAGVPGGPATADYWPRDSFAFAGYASPEAALQTFFWAVTKGDLKTALSGTAGEILEEAKKDLVGKSDDEASAKAIADLATLKAIRVLDREVRADDTVVLTTAFEDEKRTINGKVLMKRVGNEWKLSGHPDE